MPRTAALFALVAFMPACQPDWGDPGSLTCTYEGCDTDTDTTGPPGPPGDSEASPAGGTSPTTSMADPSTGTTDPDDASTTDTSPGEAPPEVLDWEVIPKSQDENGYIEVIAYTAAAEGVNMKIHNGGTIDLEPIDVDVYRGFIPAFSALQNGKYQASLVPRRGDLTGATKYADYEIDLPPAGSEGLWQTGNLFGEGQVVSIAVRKNGRVVLLATRYEGNEPRCVLLQLDRNGAYDHNTDFVQVLPGEHCSAVALTIDPVTDRMHILAYRKDLDQQLRWWVGEVPAWGMAPKTLGTGAVGEAVHGLTERDGTVVACGASTAPTGDRDATAWVFEKSLPVQKRLFDYAPPGQEHDYEDTAYACTFAGDRLVLVGGSDGPHVNNAKSERRFLLRTHLAANTAVWTVGGPGPGTQSRAVDVAIDDKGNIITGGYTCGESCIKPDGELRVYGPDGEFINHIPLGPFGPQFAGPNAIAWSPAGYVLVAMADESGLKPRYKIQAFALNGDGPLWTYIPSDDLGLQVALAVIAGPHGEVYSGGIGAGNYPAIAFPFG